MNRSIYFSKVIQFVIFTAVQPLLSYFMPKLIMLSNYLQSKNIFSQSFLTGKHFMLSHNTNASRANILICGVIGSSISI